MVIVRPSIVGAAYSDPHVGWVDNLAALSGFIFVYGIGLLHQAPGKFSNRANFIPVDYVVNTIIACAVYTNSGGSGMPGPPLLFSKIVFAVTQLDFTSGRMAKLNGMRDIFTISLHLCAISKPHPTFTPQKHVSPHRSSELKIFYLTNQSYFILRKQPANNVTCSPWRKRFGNKLPTVGSGGPTRDYLKCTRTKFFMNNF